MTQEIDGGKYVIVFSTESFLTASGTTVCRFRKTV